MDGIDTIKLQATSDGVIIAIKVVPGSSRDRVAGVLGDALKMTTSIVAEKGRANVAITRTLAKALGLPVKGVQLKSGKTKPHKRFLLRGVTVSEVRTRLAAM